MLSDTALVGIIGIVGTLLGVVWGGQLEGGRVDRALRRQAYHDYAALQLEALHKVAETRETAQAGGQEVDPLRGDFGRDYFRAVTLVQLVARPRVLKRAATVSNLFGELTRALESNPAADTRKAQADVMAELYDFNDAASQELAPW